MNEEAETLIEENVKEEFDGAQSNENEGEIEGVSPIWRVHEDEIIFSKPLIFEPIHKIACYLLGAVNLGVLSSSTTYFYFLHEI